MLHVFESFSLTVVKCPFPRQYLENFWPITKALKRRKLPWNRLPPFSDTRNARTNKQSLWNSRCRTYDTVIQSSFLKAFYSLSPSDNVNDVDDLWQSWHDVAHLSLYSFAYVTVISVRVMSIIIISLQHLIFSWFHQRHKWVDYYLHTSPQHFWVFCHSNYKIGISNYILRVSRSGKYLNSMLKPQ